MGQSASSDLQLVRFDIEIEINAPPDRVWAALVDVERWPDWMASYTSVERLSQGPLTVGSAARVRQPGLSAATYTVTELVPAWSSPGPARRWACARPAATWSSPGRTIVRRCSCRSSRPGCWRARSGCSWAAKIRRFLAIESEGLRAAAETADGGENHP